MAVPSPELFEKLASFYLGRHYDLSSGALQPDLLLYDAKDLCTHAVCVGMTGSGKTGLCLSLLEEAAIDGIPAICVDPKGDLGNLLLAFPEFRPDDFEPWLEPGEATRHGMTLPEYAAKTAADWKAGLASWGMTPERVARFREAADVAIYTPGSGIGLPLTVLQSFDVPPPVVLQDDEAMAERVSGAASGLLTLLGIEADPLLSREHILISSILDHQWRAGQSVTVAELIGLIQSPPLEKVGVLSLETFMPAEQRRSLAMQLNNLLASPAFRSWLDGEVLSIPRLLHTQEGKPRLSILSLAHLSDRERMFFVTILLHELLAWVRTQSGTGSLRAMFYMDEIAGYFPPVANPPSKPPMLTLLKQARAFGLGVTLATQNPVDLDYKGLSNIGTWFLGRLQTEQDKARVLDGLEGASVQAGQSFDRAAIGRILSGLGKRTFLMNNVHDEGPSLFQTRWAMSFLAGPLAREQISRLMEPRKQASSDAAAAHSESTASEPLASARPTPPSGVEETFLVPMSVADDDRRLVYRPAVVGEASLHFVRASAGVDTWIDVRRLAGCGAGIPDDRWGASEILSDNVLLKPEADPRFSFAELPAELQDASTRAAFEKELKDYVYRHHPLTVYKVPALKAYAPAGCSEGEARVHFTQAAHEARDAETEKLRRRYATKISALEKRIRTAEERLGRESDQLQQAKLSSVLSIGASILGAFLGRKVVSKTNVSKVSTAARSAGRTAQQHSDVQRAEQALESLREEMEQLEAELLEQLKELGQRFDVQQLEVETIVIRPRKGDLRVKPIRIAWTPWQVDSAGIATPMWRSSSTEGRS